MVIPHKEKEYKMMIDENIYNRMLKELSLDTRIQINYYYSTFKNNLAMRIRQINDEYYFTLKVKQDGYKDEYEFKIKNNSLEDERIKELLNKFEITNYEYLGFMKTTRSIHKYKYGELCVDKSEYLGTIDYEIEYELYDASQVELQDFQDVLKKFNLTYKESEYTKFKRFKERL